MSDLSAAIAAAREAVAEVERIKAEYKEEPLVKAFVLADLLAALDAAQGEAVLEVVGGADGWRGTWEHKPLSEIEVGTMLYLAPQAPPAAVQPSDVTDEYARAFHDGWLACKRGDAEPPSPPKQCAVACAQRTAFA